MALRTVILLGFAACLSPSRRAEVMASSPSGVMRTEPEFAELNVAVEEAERISKAKRSKHNISTEVHFVGAVPPTDQVYTKLTMVDASTQMAPRTLSHRLSQDVVSMIHIEEKKSLVKQGPDPCDAAEVAVALAKGVDKDRVQDGETPKESWLMLAVDSGCTHQVKELLTAGADISYEDTEGMSVILHAAKHATDGSFIKMLIDFGADITVEDSQGRTALMWAAMMGRQHVVRTILNSLRMGFRTEEMDRYLLSRSNVEDGSKDAAEYASIATPASKVLEALKEPVLQALARRGTLQRPHADVTEEWPTLMNVSARTNGTHKLACVPRRPGQRDHQYWDARSRAALDGVDALALCLKQQLCPEVASGALGDPESIARMPDLESAAVAVEGQIEYDKSVFPRNLEECPPVIDRASAQATRTTSEPRGYLPVERTTLHLAARFSRLELTAALLQTDIDPDARDVSSRTALMHASAAGSRAVVLTLLQNGVDPDLRVKKRHDHEDGYTALMFAAKYGRQQVIQLLTWWGANANDACADCASGGQTALIVAARLNRLDAARALLQPRLVEASGTPLESREPYARPDFGDSRGKTALMYAAERGFSSMCEVLIQRSSETGQLPRLLDSRDEDGKTALMYAAEEGFPEIVQTLAKFGATVSVTDRRQLSHWADQSVSLARSKAFGKIKRVSLVAAVAVVVVFVVGNCFILCWEKPKPE